MERAPLVTVVGPTASGKSDLALALAAELGGEIVNADALQLYRGMDIGTAKLRPEQREGIAHHQLDVLEVTDRKSTRLNSSHVAISYAVFCLKKKNENSLHLPIIHND